MTDEQIKHMVNRFLSWKLPADFHPDGGVQFDPDGAKKLDPRNQRYEPYGTNLLNYDQALAMVRHMIEGLAALDQRDAEVERLRLAICGGEDAPGYAMSLPLETILQVQDDNRQTWKRDSELAWDGETANSWKARAQAAEQRLKAVTEALEPFAEQANCYTAADRDTAVDWPTFEVGHFRRARQALAASPQDPAQDPTND